MYAEIDNRNLGSINKTTLLEYNRLDNVLGFIYN